MNPKCIVVGLVFLLGLCLIQQSPAQVSGSFYGALYTSEFYSDCGQPTREISAETNLVCFPSSNQILVTYGEWSTAQSISEPKTMVQGEGRYYSHFSMTNWYESCSDTITIPNLWNSYLRAKISEEDSLYSFYFSSNTNIAFVLAREMDDSGYNQSLEGLGIMVRKGNGMDESILKGHYIGFEIGGDFNGSPVCGHGNIETFSFVQKEAVFDGNGHWQGSESRQLDDLRYFNAEIMVNNNDTLVFTSAELTNENNESGTISNDFYSVTSNGYVFMTNSIMGTIDSYFVSPDGEVLVSAGATSDYACWMSIAVKTPTNMTMADLAGKTYTGTILNEELSGENDGTTIPQFFINQELFYITFQSDGTFTFRENSWRTYSELKNSLVMEGGNMVCTNQIQIYLPSRIIRPCKQGTYIVSTNGVVTLNFGNGDTGMAFVSLNGQVFIGGYNDVSSEFNTLDRGLIIGVLRNPPPAVPSSVVFDSDFSLTPTGLTFSACAPTNVPFEVIYTDNLREEGWISAGVYTNQGGGVQILDTGAINTPCRYYRASYVPW